MIVLHKHKVVFLKTKKTAGTSFEIALSKYCDLGDTVTPISTKDEDIRRELGFLGPRNYVFKGKNGNDVKVYNHIDAKSLKRILPKEVWDYKKIAIIRNPFDCIVSWYFWALRGSQNKYSLKDFLFSHPEVVVENYNIIKINEKCILDSVISFENLKNDILKLEEDVPSLSGLYETFSGINAKGKVRPKDSSGSTEELFGSNPKARHLVELLLSEEELAKPYLNP